MVGVYFDIDWGRNINRNRDLKRGKRELFTDDTVTVPQLGNKTYHVTIDKNLDYEYSPYIV